MSTDPAWADGPTTYDGPDFDQTYDYEAALALPDVDTNSLVDAHYARLEVQADVDHDLRVLSFGHQGFDAETNAARAAFLQEQLTHPAAERDLRFTSGLDAPFEAGERDLDAEAREVIAHGGDPVAVLSDWYSDTPDEVPIAVSHVQSEWEQEVSEVSAGGAEVAAMEASRDPDDPVARTEGIAAVAANWEQRAGHVVAAAPPLSPAAPAAVSAPQVAGQTASVLDRVRELRVDQDEAEIVDEGLDRRRFSAMERVEQIRDQATDLAYTIDPVPRTSQGLHY